MTYRCDDDFDDDENYCVCPHCDGYGSRECYCCGDFCCCDNGGQIECSYCRGESEVTQTRFNYYLKREAEYAKERAEVWARLEAERVETPTPATEMGGQSDG